MARVLILSFKDNAAAEAAVRQLLDAEDPTQTGWGDKAAVLGTILAASAKVEAVIARPIAMCRCPGSNDDKSGQYRKTARFGWWVHTKCNKTPPSVVRDFITNMYVGKNNLLDEIRQEQNNGEEQENVNSPQPQLESLG